MFFAGLQSDGCGRCSRQGERGASQKVPGPYRKQVLWARGPLLGAQKVPRGHRWLPRWKFGPFQPPPLPLRGSGTHSNAQNLLEGTSKVSIHSTTSQTPSCGLCTGASSRRALTLRAAWRRGGTLERGPGLDCVVTSVSEAWKKNQGSWTCPSGLLHAASLPPPCHFLPTATRNPHPGHPQEPVEHGREPYAHQVRKTSPACPLPRPVSGSTCLRGADVTVTACVDRPTCSSLHGPLGGRWMIGTRPPRGYPEGFSEEVTFDIQTSMRTDWTGRGARSVSSRENSMSEAPPIQDGKPWGVPPPED